MPQSVASLRPSYCFSVVHLSYYLLRFGSLRFGAVRWHLKPELDSALLVIIWTGPVAFSENRERIKRNVFRSSFSSFDSNSLMTEPLIASCFFSILFVLKSWDFFVNLSFCNNSSRFSPACYLHIANICRQKIRFFVFIRNFSRLSLADYRFGPLGGG